MKKVISILLIITIVISLLMPYRVFGTIEFREDEQLKIETYSITASDNEHFYTYEQVHDGEGKEIDVTTEENEYVYANVLKDQMVTFFDINGKFNNTWQGTTSNDSGYWTVLKVNDNEPRLYYKNDNTINGVKLDLDAEPAYDGNYYKISYTVENETEEEVTISLGSFADTEIADNEYATISRLANNAGVKLYDEDEDVLFTFYGKNVSEVTDVDNIWIGTYPDFQTNYFNNNTRNSLMGKDSGFTYSWTNRVLQAGEKQVFSVLIGIGSLSTAPIVELVNDTGDMYQADLIKINAKVTDADENSHEYIYYSIDEETPVAYGDYILTDNTQEFTIDLSDKGFEEDSTHLLKIWAMDNTGKKSNVIEKSIIISELKNPTLELNENWSSENVYFKVLDTNNIPEVIKKYQYRIDDGEWQDIELNTETLALDENGTAEVSIKAISKDDKESSVITKTAKVDKRAPSVEAYETDYNVNIKAEDHESGVDIIKYAWSTEERFPDSFENDYTEKFKYTGEEKGTLYLHVSSEDKVGNEIKYTKEYLKAEPADIIGEDEFVDENPRFGLKDDNKQYENGYMYKIKINDEDWRFLDIDSTYEIKNPTEGIYTIKTKTIDTLGRESGEVEKQISFSLGEPDPSGDPEPSPSVSPSVSPSPSPSPSPSASPSTSPSTSPSVSPSPSPSVSPSPSPSVSPSVSPSTSPSVSPSVSPSISPSVSPSVSPSISPSVKPSVSPSASPSIQPSPSSSPSVKPDTKPDPIIIEKVDPVQTEKPKATQKLVDDTVAKEPIPYTGKYKLIIGFVGAILLIVINGIIYKKKFKDVK